MITKQIYKLLACCSILLILGCGTDEDAPYIDIDPPSIVINAYIGTTQSPAGLLYVRYGGDQLSGFTIDYFGQ